MDDFEEKLCTVLQVPFSLEEAVKCFQEASERGNAEAQFRLGCFYMFGDGVEENEEKGVMLIHKAAEQGHIEAQYELGIDYTKGYGVEIDEEEISRAGLSRCRRSFRVYGTKRKIKKRNKNYFNIYELTACTQ